MRARAEGKKVDRGTPGCSVCWNPSGHPWKRGTNSTTWICKRCQQGPRPEQKKANRNWKAAPIDEFGVTDVELFQQRETLPADIGPGKYENAAALDVMQLYCRRFGSVDEIAIEAKVSRSWAYEVIEYWCDNFGATVELYRELADKLLP